MPAEPKAKKNTTKQPKQPPYFLILALLSILLSVGVGWIGFQTMVVAQEQAQLESLAQLEADKRANVLGQWVKTLQEDVARLGEREALAVAVAYSEENVLADYRRTLVRNMKDLQAVQFFPRGSASLNGDLDPPINFIQMDLIYKAEAREDMVPEAVKFADGWRIQLATGLPTDREQAAIGSMLLTLSLDGLRRTLSSFNNDLGQTSIQQKVGRSPVTLIASAGNADSDKHFDLAVDGSYWSVRFTPSYMLMQQAAINPIPFWAGCLVLLAMLLVASAFAARKIAARTALQKVTKARERAMMGSKDKKDIDVNVKEEDKSLLGLNENKLADVVESSEPAPSAENAALRKIFRAYDIRGIVGEQLTPAFAETLGRALGTEALEQGESALLVGRDGRVHSEELCNNLITGILSTGCNVLNLGLIPSPVLYYACAEGTGGTRSGVIVTASHNTGEYNGFKIVINGNTLAEEGISAIYTRIQRAQFRSGDAAEQAQEIIPAYIDRIFSDVALAGDVKIVIDAGNGATSEIAPQLFEELGCEVEPLFCEIDGRFPNHQPDPSRAENLQTLIAKVKASGADLGVAFDGDGDRLTVVTPKGEIIWPDRLLMLFAKDIVSRNPGADVLFDVKSTRQLNSLITSYGGRPILWKTGHSNMKQKMIETGALLGGELSGHIFIKDRWYGFDDGMYACARLLEIMTLRDQDIDSIFDAFPMHPATPEILIPIAESKKFELVKALIAQGKFQSGKLTTIDGVRVDFAKGWGLVRASNTTAALTLRFEAETEETLEQLKALFKREIKRVAPDLPLDF
ncbi:phosphomannomutase/phosphoglucomutase [Simiduia aestuariiviva]|uniref:phosphomannomutase n=1 Tax=Simiduia aestuariiviva TaxID=1510459 RepID=A0A839UT35_9GAMM|nr:phosphomannomutase/phosphoglucomutase [Simiduia aestuariiviva]